jgi:hypothetical protein
MSRPSFTFKAREYRPPAPQVQDEFEPLEPYVPKKKPLPVAVAIHTPLNRLPVLTPETLEPPKPAVTYQDQETQTEPVVVTLAREVAAEHLYMCHVRNDAAELRSDKIRLQREVDALTLDMQKLSVELHAARSAEERRLAHDKSRREQLERAEEQTRREQLERAAEEVRLAEEKIRLNELNMRTLQREKQVRQTLPLLRKPAAPAQAAKPATRTRTYK